MTPLDVDAHVAACNPYADRDPGVIARHARVIHTCLAIARLPPAASVSSGRPAIG